MILRASRPIRAFAAYGLLPGGRPPGGSMPRGCRSYRTSRSLGSLIPTTEAAFGFFEYEYGRVMRGRTVLPPDDPADLARLAQGIVDVQPPARAKLVGPDGSQIDIPEELYGVLRDVVNALSQGLAISIAPHNTMLTTQEAADLLNISRPTLVRLLTDGEIPHSMRGRHRRVLLRDILDYAERTRTERRNTLDQMAADAEDDGLYEATIDPHPTR